MTEDDRARNRYFTITAVRLAGVVMVLAGALVVRQIIAAPVLVGYGLIAIGLVDAFVMPQLLARKWRTPPE